MNETVNAKNLMTALLNYHKLVPSTILNERVDTFEYITLGLLSELAELPRYFDEKSKPEKFYSELGDCFWYASMLAHKCNFDFAYLASAVTTVETFDNAPQKSDIPEGKEEEVKYMLNRDYAAYLDLLSVETGKAASIVKKALRDSNNVYNDEQLQKLRGVLSPIINVLLYIHMLGTLQLVTYNVVSYSLTKVLENNTAKLSDRKDRGVLGGDGDER